MKKLLFLFCLLQTALTAQVSVSFAIHNNSHPLFREPDDLAIYSTVSSLPDTLLSGTRLFLNGEWHHEPGNEQIAWDLLMHLYKNQNVRVLSGEMSVSTAYLLNYYSETDQEEPYSQCLSRYGLGLEERWFFRHLYEFNKDKTKETRIAIRGVDSGGDAKDACEAIRLILEKNSIVNELNDYNTMLNEIGEMDPDSTMSVAKKFLFLYKGNLPKYHVLFKQEEKIFVDLIQELICESCATFGSSDSSKWATRENFIYSNMVQVLEEYPGANVFGKFGSAHTVLDTTYAGGNAPLHCSSFASRLQQSTASPIKGKVCVLLDYTYKAGGILPDGKLSKAFREQHLGRIYYFSGKLSGNNPPYWNEARSSFGVANFATYKSSLHRFKKDSIVSYEGYGEVHNKNITAGINYGTDEFITLGYQSSICEIGSGLPESEVGLELTANPVHPVYGFSGELKSGQLVYAGLKASVYDDTYSCSFYLKPEIGVGCKYVYLMYGYDIRTLGAPIQHLNKNSFMLTFNIPFSPRY